MSKHLLRRHPNGLLRMTTTLAVVATAAVAGIAGAPSAHASDAHDAPWVCHPVNGDGELGDGWNLIAPDHASSHIDQTAYAAGDAVYGKHISQDGRSDVYAQVADGVDPQHAAAADVSCPGTIVTEHLAVVQTVATSYDQHYDWTLGKTADRTDSWLYSPHASGAHSDTIGWTVTATASGPITTDELVSGTVTVTNDGQSDTDFTLALDPDIATADCGAGTAGAHLAVGEHVDCTYSATGHLTGDVTATASTDVGSYSDTDALAWGAPDHVVGRTATLSDSSQGFSQVVDAGDSPVVKAFSTVVDWADAPCGNSVVSNTATLSTVADPATASVGVHRQCETFSSDTAWAAVGRAGTNKYNAKGGGNWATYVTGPSGTYNLYAGQTKAAGTVSVSPSGVVTVNLANGFEFAPGGGNLHIQGYSSAPSGNPSPGQFQYQFSCTGASCSPGSITTARYYGIHLAVGAWVPDPGFGR